MRNRLNSRFRVSLYRIAALLAALLSGCDQKPDNSYQGYVEGQFVYVASPQSGRLEHLGVTRGDSVTVNQPLFALDQEPEASAAMQARQLLHADEARLADLQTGKRPAEIDVIRAQLAQAMAEQKKSAEILKSYQSQYASGGVALTDLITAKAAVETNDALARQQRSNQAVADLPGRDEQIKAQAAVVEADRAALQQATWKLQQKTIASPRSGLVFDTLYREGEWVAGGNPIVQMLPPENLEIRFFVPETVVGRLKPGQPVRVHCDGCAAEIPAGITFISPQVEYTPPVIYSNETRAKLVFMIIAKPPADQVSWLHPGQPLRVWLQ